MPEKKFTKITPQKEFKLSSLSIDNKRTVFLLTFLILFMGIGSYISLPKENFPELIIPEIYVGVAYPGNSPKVIEDQITRPIEKEIATITGLDEITSTSIQGYATIISKFDFEVDPEEALRKVKDAVDRARSDKDFPKDLPAEPNIFEVNFSEFPIMNINLSGNYSIDQLKEYGEYLEDKIEDLPEINKVEIRGVQEKELEIALDMVKAEAMEVSVDDVENAIRGENVTISGGELLVGDFRRTIRVEGEFKSPKEVEDIIIKREKGDLVYLRDIALVRFGDQEKKSYAREHSKPVVMLDVVKRSGKNLLDAAAKIKLILEEARENYLPSNLEVSVTNDQSTFTREQVSNLENSIIFGIILVVLVLLFFLGLRNALFVGIAIPLSMFMSFMILSIMGITLNVMTLFSLVLALGMLVDNGIVIVENIYRLMDEGMSRIEAAKKGVGEVAIPIIASTSTTLAVFIPLAVWPGMMGEFMKYIPFTLMIVLGSSLFVALVINPVLTSVYMKIDEKDRNRAKVVKWSVIAMAFGGLIVFMGGTAFGNLFLFGGIITLVNVYLLKPGAKNFQEKLLPILENRYKKFLNLALSGKNPRNTFLGTIVTLFLSFILLGMFTPKVEFFPINQPNYVNAFVSLPVGTDIEKTNLYTKEVERRVLKTIEKYNDTTTVNGITHINNKLVTSVIAQVGQGAQDPNEGPSFATSSPNKGRVTVSFIEFRKRGGIMTSDVMEEIRDAMRGGFPADVQVTVDKDPAGPPMDPPINIEVSGEEYDQIILIAEGIRDHINRKAIQGIEELKLDVELGKPELPIVIDREKVRAFNLSTYQVASQIRTALFGKEISTYKDGEDDYPINLRYKNDYRYNLEALLNQKITFRDNVSGKINQIPISALIEEPKRTSTYSSIKRKEQDRVITVFSNILEGSNANEVVANIKTALLDYPALPKGYSYNFTGQQEEQAKEMAFLSKALIIAVFLIFMILVSQFNSAFTPGIIITAVVFSLIGVLLGLVAFQMDFIIIMTMIGIISLAGIVVNNAIVLIDYTNLLIKRRKKELKLKEEEKLPMDELVNAIAEGGRTRLRPVLLTAITTVLGLLPLAMGINIDFITLLTDYDLGFYMGGDNVIFFGPMSWTIIFGLTFATFLTLVVVPVMYLLLNKVKYRFNLD